MALNNIFLLLKVTDQAGGLIEFWNILGLYENYPNIDTEGKNKAFKIFQALKKVFELGPEELDLTGPWTGDNFLILDIRKEELLNIFDSLIDITQKIDEGYYILHIGV